MSTVLELVLSRFLSSAYQKKFWASYLIFASRRTDDNFLEIVCAALMVLERLGPCGLSDGATWECRFNKTTEVNMMAFYELSHCQLVLPKFQE